VPPHHSAKVDGNQPDVIREVRVRRTWWSVCPTHRLGAGFPDFIVGADGCNVMFELKPDEKGKLTSHEREWHDKWRGQVAVVWNAQQVIDIVETQLARLGPEFQAGSI
jgi:hypothetical protein